MTATFTLPKKITSYEFEHGITVEVQLTEDGLNPVEVEVKFTQHEDSDGDTSWLGEFYNRLSDCEGDFVVDRKMGVLINPKTEYFNVSKKTIAKWTNNSVTAYGQIWNHINNYGGMIVDHNGKKWLIVGFEAYTANNGHEMYECEAYRVYSDGLGMYTRHYNYYRDYRYVAGFQNTLKTVGEPYAKMDENGKLQPAKITLADVVGYCLQDAERLCSYGESWAFCGVEAAAVYGEKMGQGSLWGVENDSEYYLEAALEVAHMAIMEALPIIEDTYTQMMMQQEH